MYVIPTGPPAGKSYMHGCSQLTIESYSENKCNIILFCSLAIYSLISTSVQAQLQPCIVGSRPSMPNQQLHLYTQLSQLTTCLVSTSACMYTLRSQLTKLALSAHLHVNIAVTTNLTCLVSTYTLQSQLTCQHIQASSYREEAQLDVLTSKL